MGKWERVRGVLRRVGFITGAAVPAVTLLNPTVGGWLGVVSAAALGLGYDLPRDRWTHEQRRAVAGPLVFDDDTPTRKERP